MDTLSSSVSSLTVPNLRRNSADFYSFKNPYTSSHFNFPKPTSISNKSNSHYPFTPTTTATSPRNPLIKRCSDASSSHRTSTLHCKASSGYAAALVDIAKSKNLLETIERDVTRLSKWLKHVPLLGDKEKGGVVKEILAKGKFHKYLVSLVKLLVEKNKVGIVDQVLMEFERIYDEICGTQLVFVSSGVKMEKSEVFGIAKKVHELSGAGKVKVMVKKVVDDDKKRSRSFAL